MFVEKIFVASLFLCWIANAQNVNLISTEVTPTDETIDGTVFINDNLEIPTYPPLTPIVKQILEALEPIGKKIHNLGRKPSIILDVNVPGRKLIYAATGSLSTDIAEPRTIYDAATKALEVAYKAGVKNPFLVVGPMSTGMNWGFFEKTTLTLNAVLGALYALYLPLQNREAGQPPRYKTLTYFGSKDTITRIHKVVAAIEEGRWIARDLCGADPQRMTPKEFSKYVKAVKWNNVQWEDDVPIQSSNYPLIKIFDRSNTETPEYQGMIMKAKYLSKTSPEKSLYMVGQGVTFDTGGYDLRIDGKITGMSRQKCGAAAIVGLLKTMEILETPLKITTKLVVMRNNIGAFAVVSDEIVKTMGKRIRIGFTQALGRMMLSELLAEAKEEALIDNIPDRHIYTIATMSSHVVRCYKYLMGIMDNGPAAKAKTARMLQDAGDLVSDLGEISVIRKEDYDATNGKLETEDMLASTASVSETMDRGHQIPMAFMVKLSGLDKCGLSAPEKQQIKYTHLDVTGSAGRLGVVPTGSPIAMLTQMYNPMKLQNP